MASGQLTPHEIVQRGEAVYHQKLRAEVDTESNRGKYLVVDVDTGEYEIGDEHYATLKRALAKRPEAVLYGLRIGYRATGRIGGRLTPASS